MGAASSIDEARAVDFFCFLQQQRARERELDLFPLQKIASSDVILARTICVPVVCVVASCQSVSKQTNKRKEFGKEKTNKEMFNTKNG